MKNSKKKIIFLIGLIVIICLIIGYTLHINKKENYVETQKKRIDLFFKYNLKKYTSIKIVKVEKNPMGDYFIKGYINNDKNYYFNAHASFEENFQFDGIISYSSTTLGKLFKKENPKYILDPSEIIEKEHLDKSKYEADPPAFFWF
ncbi:DUF1433 domain-containing protein [Staphylococcus caprae]|uniref:DUF1433 domain-containing protein n=1 Tax=Staphylococcus caprae TaxID=29380 RepID=UPI001C1195A2|nr:DUF1433 domain-containing protein [Staphylococcus caprae]MBU5271322.1 DUF1433 domain-containing protein [Staphylococcus caprae]MDK6297041.1 DUF1433 domain-containing protein [Staphylococcus caprae]MDK7232829.1 DUF1433 domain-containing protein [Staphylococcus caprae]